LLVKNVASKKLFLNQLPLWLYCERIHHEWPVKIGLWSVKSQRICLNLMGENPEKEGDDRNKNKHNEASLAGI